MRDLVLSLILTKITETGNYFVGRHEVTMESFQDPVKLSLDAKGLACPLPIIRVKKGINTINVGDILEVWTTDPGSIPDFQAWSRSTGHALIRVDDAESPYRFWFRRTH